MNTAERWDLVPAGCICRWTAQAAPAGPWSRERAHPACLAAHEEAP